MLLFYYSILFLTVAPSTFDWSGCTWSDGKRLSSRRISVGASDNPKDCYEKCKLYRKSDGMAPNGATVDTKTGKNCHCEFDAEVDTDFDVNYRSCIFGQGKYYTGHVHELESI